MSSLFQISAPCWPSGRQVMVTSVFGYTHAPNNLVNVLNVLSVTACITISPCHNKTCILGQRQSPGPGKPQLLEEIKSIPVLDFYSNLKSSLIDQLKNGPIVVRYPKKVYQCLCDRDVSLNYQGVSASFRSLTALYVP